MMTSYLSQGAAFCGRWGLGGVVRAPAGCGFLEMKEDGEGGWWELERGFGGEVDGGGVGGERQ